MKSGHNLFVLLAVSLAGVLAFSTAASGHTRRSADTKDCGAWVFSRTSDSLQAVSAISPTDAWAVAGDAIVHWDGEAWQHVSHPPSKFGLTGVAALASNNVWAVSPSTVEHWNGTQWTVSGSDPTGRPGAIEDNAIFARRPNDAWLFRRFAKGGVSKLEHWDGKRWAPFTSPARGLDGEDSDDFDDETTWLATSPGGDIWAVGSFQPGKDMAHLRPLVPSIQHWTGGRWQTSALPKLARQFLFSSVVAVGRDDVWASGVNPGAQAGQPLGSVIEHWDGKRWSVTPTGFPSSGEFIARVEALTASSTTHVWAVGEYAKHAGDDPQPLLLSWNGKRWTRLSVRTSEAGHLQAATALPDGTAFAVGPGLLGQFSSCPRR